MKKPMTPEERKAFGEKMKAARAAKKDTVQLTKEQFEKLMKLVEQPAQPSQPTIGSQGQQIGIVEKYTSDPAHYDDPTEKLYDMPEFRRFALRDNYRIKWNVSPTKYQTVFGTWYIEPRFELTIARRRLNADGSPKMVKDENGRTTEEVMVLGRGSFFQDPAADLLEADMAGVDYKAIAPEAFSEAMRLWRYVQFISDLLSPPARDVARPLRRRMEVIAGKPYDIEEFQSLV